MQQFSGLLSQVTRRPLLKGMFWKYLSKQLKQQTSNKINLFPMGLSSQNFSSLQRQLTRNQELSIPNNNNKTGINRIEFSPQHVDPYINKIEHTDIIVCLHRGGCATDFFQKMSALTGGSARLVAMQDPSDEQAKTGHGDYAHTTMPIKSYTDQDSILANIEQLLKENPGKAISVYPGYGFLSEKSDFVQKLEDLSKEYANRLIFLGPNSNAMAQVGPKDASKKLFATFDLPVIPGTQKTLREIGMKESSPLLNTQEGFDSDIFGFLWVAKNQSDLNNQDLRVKAIDGGGGGGQRVIPKEIIHDALYGSGETQKNAMASVESLISAAKSEGKTQFGNSDLIVEANLSGNFEHVEMQVVMDKDGQAIFLPPRNCSFQAGDSKKYLETLFDDVEGQKILDSYQPKLQNMLHSIGYAGAATIEFLYDRDQQKFIALEVNTRVQVEHPVSEDASGCSITAILCHVANGGTLYELEPIHKQIDLDRKNSDKHVLFNGQLRVNMEGAFTKKNGRFMPTTTTGNNIFEQVIIPDMPGVYVPGNCIGTGQGIPVSGDSNIMRVEISITKQEVLDRYSSDEIGEKGYLKLAKTLWAEKTKRFLINVQISGPSLNLTPLWNAAEQIGQDKVVPTDQAQRDPYLYETAPAKIQKKQEAIQQQNGALQAVSDLAGGVKASQQKINPNAENSPYPIEELRGLLSMIKKGIEKQSGIKDKLQELGPKGFTKWIQENNLVIPVYTNQRDHFQSDLANRDRSVDTRDVLDPIRKLFPFFMMEGGGGARAAADLLFKQEDHGRVMKDLHTLSDTISSWLFRSTGISYYAQPMESLVLLFKESIKSGCTMPRIFDACNSVDKDAQVGLSKSIKAYCQAIKELKNEGFQGVVMPMFSVVYTGALTGGDTVYNAAYYRKLVHNIIALAKEQGLDQDEFIIDIKDMVGQANVSDMKELVRIIKEDCGFKGLVHTHMHNPKGDAARVQANSGADLMDAAFTNMGKSFGQVSIQDLIKEIKASGKHLPQEVVDEHIQTVTKFYDNLHSYYNDMKVSPSQCEAFLGPLGARFFRIPGGQAPSFASQIVNNGLPLTSISDGRVAGWAYAFADKILADTPDFKNPYHRLTLVTPTSQATANLGLDLLRRLDVSLKDETFLKSDTYLNIQKEADRLVFETKSVSTIDPSAQENGYKAILWAPDRDTNALKKELTRVLLLDQIAKEYLDTLNSGNQKAIRDLNLDKTVRDFIAGEMGEPNPLGFPSYRKDVMEAYGLTAPHERPFNLEAFKQRLHNEKGISWGVINSLDSLTLIAGAMLPDDNLAALLEHMQKYGETLLTHELAMGNMVPGKKYRIQLPNGKSMEVELQHIEPKINKMTNQKLAHFLVDGEPYVIPITFAKRIPEIRNTLFATSGVGGAGYIKRLLGGVEFGQVVTIGNMVLTREVSKKESTDALFQSQFPTGHTQGVLIPLRKGLSKVMELIKQGKATELTMEQCNVARFLDGESAFAIVTEEEFKKLFPNGYSHDESDRVAEMLIEKHGKY